MKFFAIDNVFCFSAMVTFTKNLMGDFSGRSEDFEAAPGYGLKCQVSNIDGMIERALSSEPIQNYLNRPNGYPIVSVF